ncbi:MAG TPA: hypothetical protein DEA43_04670 [Candidatus Moranbacteria bacterium]|nr:hypothetical protein [Candidatus Moranbacteria bacterium]HBT46147.1 hypothetical protein [Candidatus Moranbacteria bacterium]
MFSQPQSKIRVIFKFWFKVYFLFCLFSFEATESDSELLASNHSSSIAKRAEKGSRQNKTAPIS